MTTYAKPQERMTVKAILHKIGQQEPYFSLTCDIEELHGSRWVDVGGGAAHEAILARYPKYADIAALHLSNMDGVPMHAYENGWYLLEGALSGLGSQYHAGNGSNPKSADLAVFARHCRISLDEARTFAESLRHNNDDPPRKRWRAYMESMRPRWKAEADACIAHHNLTVQES